MNEYAIIAALSYTRDGRNKIDTFYYRLDDGQVVWKLGRKIDQPPRAAGQIKTHDSL